MVFSSVNSVILFLLFLLSFLCFTTQAADPTYVYHSCPNTTTFAINSTFQSNLNSLLSSLPSNASRTNGFSTGFYNATAGRDPDDVYGLFLCRGDLSSDTCRDCVNFATRDVAQRCPIEKVAVIWYDECLLRYSNESIFSVLRDFPSISLATTQNSTNPGRFNYEKWKLMNDAAADAVNSSGKFAARNNNVSVFETVYGLVQCTPDLSDSDCFRCLQKAIAGLTYCCGDQMGGQVLLPSCFVRYEVYPFYNQTSTTAPRPLLPPPPLDIAGPEGLKGRKTGIVVGVSTSAIVLVVSFGVLLWRMLRNDKKEEKLYNQDILHLGEEYSVTAGERQVESLDFPLLPLGLLLEATQNFSQENKLGEGGFGPVYKGVLPDGKELAVKRLSRASAQGLKEFKNEVHLIAKLQHKNLVRLLGCCLEGDELMLVYEYMPNKSLDVFLFDPTWGAQLDWKRRISIINGIARGILYLHEDSRLKIIHRDLKASNVLLDHEMNPKISDFGLARIFCGNQFEANTNRIVGTYGYMSPEYAMEGLFSVKSDVFSFGVLLLEIVSGKRNNRFHLAEEGQNLLTYTWKLRCKGQAMELLDPTLAQSCVHSEALKCINIGLLCVQEDPAYRPTMSYVVHMLGSDSMTLPRPNQPAFSVGRVVVRGSESSSDVKICSANQVSISTLSPR